MRTGQDGGFVPQTLQIVHCEGAVDSSELRVRSVGATSVPQHPDKNAYLDFMATRDFFPSHLK